MVSTSAIPSLSPPVASVCTLDGHVYLFSLYFSCVSPDTCLSFPFLPSLSLFLPYFYARVALLTVRRTAFSFILPPLFLSFLPVYIRVPNAWVSSRVLCFTHARRGTTKVRKSLKPFGKSWLDGRQDDPIERLAPILTGVWIARLIQN